MIVLQNVTKIFRDLTVLDNVSLRIDPGEFVCVTGPSGAGKSTLLSLFVGAQDVSDGVISVDDVDLRTVPAGALQLFRRKVGMVFQEYKLLQNRTVEENIAFPLEVIGATDAEIADRVQELLRRMDLTARAKALPWELSGGEKARTAIARAIVHKPLILLADEPTGNLDPEQAVDVLHLFREIHAEGTTVILATHDVALVNSLHTRVVALERGKVVRDSVGGYAGSAEARHGTGSHKVFASEEGEDQASVAAMPTPTPEPEPERQLQPEPEQKPVEASLPVEPAHKKKRRGPIRRKGSDEDVVHVKHKGHAGTHRKVRITSIHSD